MIHPFAQEIIDLARMGPQEALIDFLEQTHGAIEHAHAFNNFPLRKAASNGDLKSVRLLLAFPAVQAQILSSKNSPLIEAVENSDLHMVCALLEYPVILETITAFHHWAFKIAIKNRQLEILKALLRAIEAPPFPDDMTEIEIYTMITGILDGTLQDTDEPEETSKAEKPKIVVPLERRASFLSTRRPSFCQTLKPLSEESSLTPIFEEAPPAPALVFNPSPLLQKSQPPESPAFTPTINATLPETPHPPKKKKRKKRHHKKIKPLTYRSASS